MDQSKLLFGVALIGLSLLLPAGAYAQSVIEKRSQIMEETFEALKVARAAVKQKDYATVQTQAKVISDNMSPGLLKLFPKGSLSDKSEAHPDIWARWDDFGQGLERARKTALALQAAAAAKDDAEMNAQLKSLGSMTGGACGECHLAFNKKRMKKQ